MYYFGLFMVVFQIISFNLISELNHIIKWEIWLWVLFISANLLLTICYIVTMSYTWKTIRQTIRSISDHVDLSDKYTSIKVQFIIYLLAFTLKLIVSVILIKGSISNWDPFMLALIQIISLALTEVLPICWILYIHRCTFKVENEMSEQFSEITLRSSSTVGGQTINSPSDRTERSIYARD